MSYDSAHKAVVREKGKARQHQCVDCGQQALDWSYTNDDPNALPSPNGMYSTDIDRYVPRCRICHRQFDHPKLVIPEVVLLIGGINHRLTKREAKALLARVAS